jgi:hypothetical protein
LLHFELYLLKDDKASCMPRRQCEPQIYVVLFLIGARESIHIFAHISEETLLIMMTMLGPTVQELYAWETRRPGFVHSCLRAYIISMGEAMW